MQPIDDTLPGHIDQALAAMASVAADLATAGFNGTPFWIGASDTPDKRSRMCVAFSARKPTLHSAHDTLRWERVRTDIYRTLISEVTPLLYALRDAAPVLTGPMGNIKLQHTPDRGGGLPKTSFSFNGRELQTDDLRSGVLEFVPKIAHLARTRNKRISAHGFSRPMIAATVEEIAVFEDAVRGIKNPYGFAMLTSNT